MSIIAQGFGLEAPTGSGVTVAVTQGDVTLLTAPLEITVVDGVQIVILSAT